MRRTAILILGAVLACAAVGACSSGDSTSSSSLDITTSSTAPEVTTSSTPAPAAAVPVSTTSGAAADCQQTISDVKTAITKGLDSVDANPKTESSAGKSIFRAFARMSYACRAQSGTALSEVIQFLNSQANGRKPATQQAINGALTAACKAVPNGVALTPEAQTTCAAHH